MSVMTWEAILLFLLKMGARRQINWLLRKNDDVLLSHLSELTGINLDHLQTVAHGDTINDLFTKLDPVHLLQIQQDMIRQIIRKRALEHARLLDDYYMIAFDATGLFHRHSPHCPHCLISKSKTGEILYSHNVLEAKLITESGLALSICSEHIENLDGDAFDLSKEKEKQDCELKAFKRLAPKIKNAFPQLRICLLFDSLYAAQTVMDICEEYGWKFIICFKEGSIPSVYNEFEMLLPLQAENRYIRETKTVHQQIKWATDITYTAHTLHLIHSIDQYKERGESKNFLHLSNIKPTKSTVCSIANGAGRQRWKIENQGFNMQKNGGYNLEHIYSENENAAKCLYICLQIAHMINQFIEKGSLIGAICKKYGSLKNLTQRLSEALRFIKIEHSDIVSLLEKPFQIRLQFNSS